MEMKTFFEYFLRHKWLVILSSIIAVGVSAALSIFYIAPVYQSTTTLYISNNNMDYANQVTYEGLLVGKILVKDYQELIKSRTVTEKVITELDLKNITPKELADKIRVNLKSDTRILEVTVFAGSSQNATAIADKVVEVFSKKAGELLQLDTFSVIDPAGKQEKPLRPKIMLNMLIALITGFIISISKVTISYFLNDTVKNVEDIKKYMGVNVLGTVPRIEKKNSKFSEEPGLCKKLDLTVKEHIRTICTNILFSDRSRKIKMIAIAGCRSGYGKTEIAIHLVNSMAKIGMNVIYIDGDLHKPMFKNTRGCIESRGLSNLLSGHAVLDEVINRNEWEGACFISSGSHVADPSELICSKKFIDIMGNLRDLFDMVIIDAPSLCTATESGVISSISDGTIIIVEPYTIKYKDSRSIIEKLKMVNANILGVVLNLNDKNEFSDGHYVSGNSDHTAVHTNIPFASLESNKG